MKLESGMINKFTRQAYICSAVQSHLVVILVFPCDVQTRDVNRRERIVSKLPGREEESRDASQEPG